MGISDSTLRFANILPFMQIKNKIKNIERKIEYACRAQLRVLCPIGDYRRY